MIKAFLLFIFVSAFYQATWAQTSLTCQPQGSVNFFFTGASGACVTRAPSSGNLRFNFGSNCANTNQDPVLLQSQCSCCPIFNNDCFRYTNTNTSPSTTSDFFTIGGIPYLLILTYPLPVTLTGVKAYEKYQGIQVEWTTQTETNMDRYEVERSQDGRNFIKIGTVTPRNNCVSGCSYELTDPAPFNGINFYRIKMVDRSGPVSFSQVMKVATGMGSEQITVAPNPVNGNSMVLQMNNLSKGKYTISILNATGQAVWTQVMEHNGGSATQTIAFPLHSAAGVYQLRITGEGKALAKTILKQ